MNERNELCSYFIYVTQLQRDAGWFSVQRHRARNRQS